MILIPIDPSISCTGVAVFELDKLIRCARIKPKQQVQKDGVITKFTSWQKIDQIIEALDLLLSEHPGASFSIEITSGKTAGRFGNKKISGLGTYGMVVGQVVRWAIERVGPDRVHQFYENDWTRQGKKDRRQEHCRYTFPFYAEHWYEQDKIKHDKSGRYTGGGDVSDAIMLGDYTLQQIKTGMLNPHTAHAGKETK